MPAEFRIGEATPERVALAAELIASGHPVDFGGYELHVSKDGALVVAILTWDSVIPEEVEGERRAVVDRLDATLAQTEALDFLRHKPRRYELIATWGKGSTWLGYWSTEGFVCSKRPTAENDA